MIDLSEKNLLRIQEQKMQGLEGLPIEVFPFYQGLSLANIPASICEWFQIPSLQTRSLDIPEPSITSNKVKNIIFLVIDGLPFKQMQAWLEEGLQNKHLPSNWKHIEESGMFSPLTSVVPSTTANALTCLWTGKLPSEHGVIGYELFLKEFNITLNMILQTQVHPIPVSDSERAPHDLSTFLPVPTLGSHFRKHGIQPYAFQHESICNSGLSLMLFSDVQKIAYTSPQDMFRKAHALLETQPSEQKYIYLYWSDIDTLSHRNGPDSRKTRHAWHWFSHLLENFLDERMRSSKNDTLLIITSDHGQIPTQIRPLYDVRSDREFMECLDVPPSGESRFPYLFVKPEKLPAFQAHLSKRWADDFVLIPSANIAKSGLFGEKEMSTVVRNRIGTHAAIPKGNAYWWWANKENLLLGRHGGFSSQEMITPLFILPI